MSCLLICEDALDQGIFMNAFNDIFPRRTLYLATNGIDALHMLAQGDIQPDFIFAELNLPLMNGVEFLRHLKRQDDLKKIPVIIHSSQCANDRIGELKELGALAIHIKPYEYFSICNVINIYFHRESPLLNFN